MVSWIMKCVSSMAFSLNINGNFHGFFQGKRGLRQDDPHSPYLFTLVMKVLTLMLRRGVHSVKVIAEAIEEFKVCSGLVPSLLKSTIFFANCSTSTKNAMRDLLNFEIDATIKEMEKLMRGFLWCQGNMKNGKAKVKWDDVCLPKQEGGLGCRQKAFGLFRFLRMKVEVGRKFLRLRDIFRSSIIHILGNGDNTSAWFNTWCDVGPLAGFISNRDIYAAGFTPLSTVSDIVDNSRWKWPHFWIDKYAVLNHISAPILSNELDNVKWKNYEGDLQDFSVATTWHSIRPRANSVPWYSTVWFSQCILRNSFIV
ncbi:uncharacterized protein [Rutidosis leptorrhynchoides]|uniref:uncharacterized protein n=1 Tax=Rutidosis leptorrhynchoides TaxID=125765 RepID=UPI003A9A1A6C